MIPDVAGETLRVAVLAHSERQRRYLAELLEPNGVQVVDDHDLRDCIPDRLDQRVADVLLVDLHEEDDGDLDLDLLLDRTQLPMLFNDGESSKRHAPKSIAGRAWGRRLADKLAALVRDETAQTEASAAAPMLKLVRDESPFPGVLEAPINAPATASDHGGDPAPSLDSHVDHDPAPQPEVELDFEAVQLPDLEANAAVAEHASQERADGFDGWELEPMSLDAPGNDVEGSEQVHSASDADGAFDFGDALEFDAPPEPSEVDSVDFADVPVLSEDYSLADALAAEGSEAEDGAAVPPVDEWRLDEVPILEEDAGLSAYLSDEPPLKPIADVPSAEVLEDQLAAQTAAWLDLDDLAELAEEIEPAAVPWLDQEAAPVQTAAAEVEDAVDGTNLPVWVLGASIGGPQALKEFIAELPADVPAAFIVAQHIGNGFVELLANQLDRVTALQVRAAETGLRLGAGQIVVAPVEQRITFSDGVIALQPNRRKSVYSPSIDEVMTEVATAFGHRANAIVFSGMGCDGVEGARAVVAAGGTVWGQESSTCIISSMADAARDAGVVSESGAPAELAARLLASLNGE